jgi:hypothetical protein
MAWPRQLASFDAGRPVTAEPRAGIASATLQQMPRSILSRSIAIASAGADS